MNVNQANIDFILDEERPKDVLLRLKLPKFLDTQAIEIDSQPKYIKIIINGNVFYSLELNLYFIYNSKNLMISYFRKGVSACLAFRSDARFRHSTA